MQSRVPGGWAALMAALLIGLYLCWRILQPFVDVLLWATVLVVVFRPAHGRLLARFGHPGWTATVSTLLVIVTILGPVTLITLAVANEVRDFARTLEANPVRLLDFDSPLFGPLLRWMDQYVDIERYQNPAFVRERLESWTGALANRTLGVVGGAVSVVVQMFLVIFTMFYLFRDGDAIRKAATDMLPLERAQMRDVLGRTREVIGATVYGVIVIALIQGVLGGAIFWTLGLPSPLLWGVVMFFLSMIPMAGAFLVWAPAAVFLALTGEWFRAGILVACGAESKRSGFSEKQEETGQEGQPGFEADRPPGRSDQPCDPCCSHVCFPGASIATRAGHSTDPGAPCTRAVGSTVYSPTTGGARVRPATGGRPWAPIARVQATSGSAPARGAVATMGTARRSAAPRRP